MRVRRRGTYRTEGFCIPRVTDPLPCFKRKTPALLTACFLLLPELVWTNSVCSASKPTDVSFACLRTSVLKRLLELPLLLIIRSSSRAHAVVCLSAAS